MNGKALLAKLLGTTAAPAAAVAVAAGAPGLSAEQQAAGNTELEGLVEKAFAEGSREGRKAERERFGTVLTGEEVTGRMGLAITLLSTTDLGADAINTSLKSAAKEAGPATGAATTVPGTAPLQPIAGDPLVGSDPIAEATPRVDPGAAQPPVEGPDEKAIVDLWKGAIGSISNGGITADSPWSGLTAGQAH